MHKRDCNRSLADARRHTLHRTVPNIADHKDAGNICLQKPWLAIELPTVWPFPITRELRAGIDKPEFIAFHDVRKPVSVWSCSDHYEERVSWDLVYRVRLRAINRNGLEMIVAMRFNDGCVEFDLNVGSSFELIDQVLRHRSRERRAAHKHDDTARVPGKVHRGLSRTVCAADNVDVLVFCRHCLGHRRAVIDSRSG